jgi:hypothetical protein
MASDGQDTNLAMASTGNTVDRMRPAAASGAMQRVKEYLPVELAVPLKKRPFARARSSIRRDA